MHAVAESAGDCAVCQNNCRSRSLFQLCLSFIGNNVACIDSLVDFPESIGKLIFSAAIEGKAFQHLSDSDSSKVLKKFNRAYGQLLLDELSITNYLVLESHLESFCSFSHITKLNIAGCHIGDRHEVICFISQLNRY